MHRRQLIKSGLKPRSRLRDQPRKDTAIKTVQDALDQAVVAAREVAPAAQLELSRQEQEAAWLRKLPPGFKERATRQVDARIAELAFEPPPGKRDAWISEIIDVAADKMDSIDKDAEAMKVCLTKGWSAGTTFIQGYDSPRKRF